MLGSCDKCRHAHLERREKIIDAVGLGTLGEFADDLETVYFCCAPTRIGREVGAVPELSCALFLPGAKPDMSATDARIAAAEERWARKDAKDRDRW